MEWNIVTYNIRQEQHLRHLEVRFPERIVLLPLIPIALHVPKFPIDIGQYWFW